MVPLAADNGSIWRHSFGGLFVLWLMFTRPEAFRNWIAVRIVIPTPVSCYSDAHRVAASAALALMPGSASALPVSVCTNPR
ncbi:MAG TPA: hypothetical protein VGC40_05220 [Paenirhodobacter sp.]